jgi:hypothetical protein
LRHSRRSTLDVSCGADDAYQSCGCLAAARDGFSAARARSSSSKASSRITQSGEKPLPDVRDRAMNNRRLPSANVIPSLPWDTETTGRNASNTGVSHRDFARRNASRQLLN